MENETRDGRYYYCSAHIPKPIPAGATGHFRLQANVTPPRLEVVLQGVWMPAKMDVSFLRLALSPEQARRFAEDLLRLTDELESVTVVCGVCGGHKEVHGRPCPECHGQGAHIR